MVNRPLPRVEDTALAPKPTDWRPVPDPTELTTRQLLREMAVLKELLETRAEALSDRIDRVREEIDKLPAYADVAVAKLQALHEEKFNGIGIQFRERDIAVSAALLAAEKAVGEQNRTNAISISKSESAFTKQIEQLGQTMQTLSKSFDDRVWALTKGLDDKIADIKDRVTTIEGRTTGSSDASAARNAASDNTMKIIGVAIAGFMAVMAIVTWFGIQRVQSSVAAQPAAVAVVPVQPGSSQR